MDEINFVKHALDSKFKIKDLESLRNFLGFEIDKTSSGIFFNQIQYTLELLQDIGNLALKPSSTLIDLSLELSTSDGTPLADPTIYLRLIGRLIYLTNIRRYICFIVQHLIQFISKPLESHYAATIRLIRYLKSSLSIVIILLYFLHMLILTGLDALIL